MIYIITHGLISHPMPILINIIIYYNIRIQLYNNMHVNIYYGNIIIRYDELNLLHNILEYKAAAINMRSLVNEPIISGYIMQDIYFPLGKGQRMLIIGDSITGKSSFGISCCINNNISSILHINYANIGISYSSLLRTILPLFYIT